MNARLLLLSLTCWLGLGGCSSEADERLHPGNDYILFASGVSSKGVLVSDLKNQTFGVLGYSYTGAWSTVQAQAVPDVFYNQAVACDADGICSYTPLKQWDYNASYAFFAYYPHGNSSISLSGETMENTPYLIYTLPLASGRSYSPTVLTDVMTAVEVDRNNRQSNEVQFVFKHRLFCLDFEVLNWNDTDETIRDLSVTIDTLRYAVDTLSLDHRLPDRPGGRLMNNVTFQLAGNSGISIPSTGRNGEPLSLSGEEGHLLLIPQTRMSGTLSFERKKQEGDGYETMNVRFSSEKEFRAGNRYVFQINFSNTAITIAVIEAEEWRDNDTYIEFE